MGPVIDPEQALWMMQGAPTITLASSDEARRPSLGQAIGCRIDDGGRRVTVFLVGSRNTALLADLRAGRAVAAVFTHSFTTRSLQVKSKSAREVPLRDGDRERITAYVGSVALDWSTYGVPDAFTRVLLARDDETIVALELVPHVAFDQTPGPRAGTPLPGAS